MLSYRHGFHAGNFADVVKHAVLMLAIQSLLKKDAPLCYLDTHAGAGRYDLHAAPARKTNEFRDGIARIWSRTDIPALLTPYLDAVRALNPEGELRNYPGSPLLARTLLRDQDRMVLMELHTTEYPILKQEFAHDQHVAVHHVDGFQAIKGFVPPKERRGLVLMDPSYEVKTDFDHAVATLQGAYERWPTGTYALWYPVLERALVNRLERRLVISGMRKVLHTELCIRPEDIAIGLNGCGMVLINPPWQLDEQIRQLMPWLQQVLTPEGKGAHRTEWLVGE